MFSANKVINFIRQIFAEEVSPIRHELAWLRSEIKHLTKLINRQPQPPPPKPPRLPRQYHSSTVIDKVTKESVVESLQKTTGWVSPTLVAKMITGKYSGSLYQHTVGLLTELTKEGTVIDRGGDGLRKRKHFKLAGSKVDATLNKKTNGGERKSKLKTMLWHYNEPVTASQLCDHFYITDNAERQKIEVNLANYADTKVKSINDDNPVKCKRVDGKLVFWVDNDPTIY